MTSVTDSENLSYVATYEDSVVAEDFLDMGAKSADELPRDTTVKDTISLTCIIIIFLSCIGLGISIQAKYLPIALVSSVFLIFSAIILVCTLLYYNYVEMEREMDMETS